MDFGEISQIYESFGLLALMLDLGIRSLNQFFFFKDLVGMTIELPWLDKKYLQIPEGFEGRFLSHDEVKKFANDPDNDLPESFLDYAFGKKDECYALLHNGELAAYGWYSNNPTRISNDLCLHFSNSYIYMYRGFTRKEFRGKRLHAVGMANALNKYAQIGYKGLISYVEANNFRSLKSVFRMGYKKFGNIYVLKLFGYPFVTKTTSCRKFGFDIKKFVNSELISKNSIFSK